MQTYITSGYNKLMGNAEFPCNLNEFTVYAAKNESENCTVAFRSDVTIDNLTLSVKDGGKFGLKTEMFLIHLIPIKDELWPDPLEPLRAPFSVGAGVTAAVSIRFYTAMDTPAGDDSVIFELKDASGEVLETIKINVHVWAFTYPEKQTCSTSVGLYNDALAKQYGFVVRAKDPVPEDKREELHELSLMYYEYMLEQKISPIVLPYDILDPRADKYMSDIRQTSFQVPFDVDDETLAKYYAKLKSNPDWLKKAYLYPLDEPTKKEMLSKIAEHAERYRRICPDIKVGTAFFCNIPFDETRDQVQILTEELTMLCPKVCNWNPVDDGWGRGIPDNPRFKTFALRMKDFQAQGKTLWSYVAWEPEAPYANVLVNENGTNHRILFWQQYLNGVTGFLYWCANEWNVCPNPWTDAATVKWLSENVYGDGNLLYPGHRVGYDGPCGSIRLNAITDGIEDFELLTLAEQYLGREKLTEITSRVTRGVADYTSDPDVFDRARIEIGNLLEKAMNK